MCQMVRCCVPATEGQLLMTLTVGGSGTLPFLLHPHVTGAHLLESTEGHLRPAWHMGRLACHQQAAAAAAAAQLCGWVTVGCS
jgi:hypothetical protein